MIRLLLILLVALLVGTGLSLGLAYDLGYIRISLGNYLIETNFWLRRIPYAICAGLFLWMAAQVMGASGGGRGAPAGE